MPTCALITCSTQLKTSLDLKETTLWESRAKSVDEVSPFSSPSPGGDLAAYRRKRRRCFLDNPIDFCNIDEYNQWRLEDIARAGRLLKKPPLEVSFDDEFEMRKVFSMIYDVFRFKLVLQQALKNIHFYERYPQLEHESTRVWLLLYDMYLRKFSKREPEVVRLKNILFKEADLLDIEYCLESNSVKIAAALTRIRIQNSAYSLITLLPPHLQDDKVAVVVSNPIITGWMNTFRIKTKRLANEHMRSIGFELIEEPIVSQSSLLNLFNPKERIYIPLSVGKYKWDKLCPQVIYLYPENRTEFIRSEVFAKHEIIIQDRSFMIGPTIFTNLLEFYELYGDVVQTHISSPRSTAFLASLLINSKRCRNFIAFGCGSKLSSYRAYMNALGVTNVRLYAENFVDVPHGANMIDKVVGIFANPPSSYSAVSDPIDLICSRGGDLSMLEVLSESEMTDDSRKRVAKVLEQQRETLKHAMARPQVQFILYQTHSIVPTENEVMVEKVIEYINQRAYDVHFQAAKEKEQAALAEAAGNQIVNRLMMGRQDTIKKTEEPTAASGDNDLDAEGESRKASEEEIEVPLSDQFETADLPDFCPNRDACLDFEEDGVFLSLIKRKEVIQLNSKYLIKIAEVRGIFGDNSANEARTNVKVTKRSDKKSEEQEAIEMGNRKRRLKRRGSNMDSLISRLNTPTQASLKRSHHHRMSSVEHKFMFFDPYQEWCPKYAGVRSEYNLSVLSDDKLSLHSVDEITRARIWWRETIEHVRNVIRRKKLCDEEDMPALTLKRQFGQCKEGDFSKRFRSSYCNRVPYPLPVRILEFRQYNSENSLLYRAEKSSKAVIKAARLSRQNAIASDYGRRFRVRSSQSC
ncbi:AAEL012498-PA [Aedes aegypti]|uniref:AAEL012498-PA n=1 Tax=Aedes aegypti TaxID=7159 RepID=Q16LX0_AEDAE|nr:AAEL012498-PA [Aedes aegypti]